ncbi:MAG: ATP-binding cassette domain-containing protein [Flavobacteriales bacterium]
MHRGENVMLGKSGSGKSVLIKLRSHRTRGSIEVLGQDMSIQARGAVSDAVRIGFLFQSKRAVRQHDRAREP